MNRLVAIDMWKPLDDISNYEINECGDIRHAKHKRIRVCPINTHGYRQFAANGKSKIHQVHRLVAKTFIPNPNNYGDVDHIDRNKLNNHVSNLRWCTRKENVRNSAAFKITDEQVEEIRQSCEPQVVLAIKYGVTNNHINRIQRGHLR